MELNVVPLCLERVSKGQAAANVEFLIKTEIESGEKLSKTPKTNAVGVIK